MEFGLGYDPAVQARAHQRLLTSGRMYRVVATETPPPAFSLSDKRLRHLEQGQAGTCFPPGTRVRMADGSERKIEEIRPLEEVLTAEGNTGTVMQLMARRHDGTLINLKLWGHSHLKMTPEHPILTRRGYIAAADLRVGDWVALPRHLPATNAIIQPANHVSGTIRAQRGDRMLSYGGVRGRKALKAQVKALPDAIGLTPGAGRIFGMFLAEGSTDAYKIVWTFNLAEKDTLAAELVGLLRSEWGLDPNVVMDDHHHVCRVKVYGSLWARLFESLCSSGAALKGLHPDLMSGPREFLEPLFDAWMAGDGNPRRAGMRGVSVSHDLALAMYDIAQALGRMPSLLKAAPIVNQYAKARLHRWEVSLQSKGENYRVQMDDRHVWRSVRGIEHEDYTGPVFNIGVEGDNSYVAEGVGVHNCWAHSGAQNAEVSANALGYQAFPVCRMLVGWVGKQLEGGGNPSNGGSPTDALLSMTEEKGSGIAHEDLYPYTDDARRLGSRPPDEVFEDAQRSHLVGVVDVQSDDDARRLISSGNPVSNGQWWPYGWDSHQTFMTTIGPGAYGHALLEMGYVQAGVWDDHDWWQLDNWHGLLYPPLDADKAAKVPGYKPIRADKTSDFWVRGDVYRAVQAKGGFIRVAGADLKGIERRQVALVSFADSFPV